MAAPKVLMLSGDARLMGVYKRLFEERGVGFKGVASPEKAVQFIHDKQPAAFIADRATPKADMFDVIEEVSRFSGHGIPVFVLSHVSDADDIARARELGVVSYVLSLHTHPSRVVERVIQTIRYTV